MSSAQAAEVLRLRAQGMAPREVAEQLDLRPTEVYQLTHKAKGTHPSPKQIANREIRTARECIEEAKDQLVKSGAPAVQLRALNCAAECLALQSKVLELANRALNAD